MDESIRKPKTVITYLLDRILARHIQTACGLFSDVSLQLAAESLEMAQHLQWSEKLSLATIQSLQPGLTREEIDSIFDPFRDRFPIIPEELYQLYQWRNGMVGNNLGWSYFIRSLKFVPLQVAINRYIDYGNSKSLDKRYDSRRKYSCFEIFDRATDTFDNCVLVLGDSKVAPVIGYEDLDFRFPSLTHFLIKEFVGGWKTLAHTDLSYINLPMADMRGIDCFYTNLYSANLEMANLWKANLSYANLSNSNLINANLSEAILTGANLTNAVLKDANLWDADLSGAIFFNTVMPDGEITISP